MISFRLKSIDYHLFDIIRTHFCCDELKSGFKFGLKKLIKRQFEMSYLSVKNNFVLYFMILLTPSPDWLVLQFYLTLSELLYRDWNALLCVLAINKTTANKFSTPPPLKKEKHKFYVKDWCGQVCKKVTSLLEKQL